MTLIITTRPFFSIVQAEELINNQHANPHNILNILELEKTLIKLFKETHQCESDRTQLVKELYHIPNVTFNLTEYATHYSIKIAPSTEDGWVVFNALLAAFQLPHIDNPKESVLDRLVQENIPSEEKLYPLLQTLYFYIKNSKDSDVINCCSAFLKHIELSKVTVKIERLVNEEMREVCLVAAEFVQKECLALGQRFGRLTPGLMEIYTHISPGVQTGAAQKLLSEFSTQSYQKRQNQLIGITASKINRLDRLKQSQNSSKRKGNFKAAEKTVTKPPSQSEQILETHSLDPSSSSSTTLLLKELSESPEKGKSKIRKENYSVTKESSGSSQEEVASLINSLNLVPLSTSSSKNGKAKATKHEPAELSFSSNQSQVSTTSLPSSLNADETETVASSSASTKAESKGKTKVTAKKNLPTPTLDPIEISLTHRVVPTKYQSRVTRWDQVGKNFESIRSFKGYEAKTNKELLPLLKAHCFPRIERLLGDKKFIQRYTNQPKLEGAGNKVFHLSGSLDGVPVIVTIAYDDKGRIYHKYANPVADNNLWKKGLLHLFNQQTISPIDSFYDEEAELYDNEKFSYHSVLGTVSIKDVRTGSTLTLNPLHPEIQL